MKYKQVELTASQTRLFWHGTSTVNLKSILTHGLDFSKAKFLNYDPTQNKTFSAIIPGTYLSPHFAEAYSYAYEHAKKHNADPVIVLVRLSLQEQTLYVDEDDLYSVKSRITKTPLDLPYEERIKRGVEETTAELQKLFSLPVDEIQAWLSLNNKTVRAFVKAVLREQQAWKEMSLNRKKLSEERKDTERAFCRKAASLLRLNSKLNVAVKKPITFEGDPRIVGIFEGEVREGTLTLTLLKEKGKDFHLRKRKVRHIIEKELVTFPSSLYNIHDIVLR